MLRLARQEDRLFRDEPKSTNPPAIELGSHPTCFALGLVTCVYSFTEAVWPFLWMVALQKAEEVANTFVVFAVIVISIPRAELGKCRQAATTVSHGNTLTPPLFQTVPSDSRVQMERWKTLQLCRSSFLPLCSLAAWG